MRQGPLLTTAALCGLALIAATPAAAKCTRLAFSVNDYGKPIEDAKNMLDKYIAKTMAEKGVAKYRTGKKDVNCEFFITLLVVDEYTCKAEADVCWDEAPGAAAQQAKAAGPADAKPLAKSATPVEGKKVESKKVAAPPVAKETAAPAALSPAQARAVPAASDPLEAVATPPASKEPVFDEKAAAPTPSGAPVVKEISNSPAAPSDDAEPENTESATHSPPPQTPDTPASVAPAVTETGAVERFAAPKKIVIPEPIQVKRGIPVDPKAAAPQEPAAP